MSFQGEEALYKRLLLAFQEEHESNTHRPASTRDRDRSPSEPVTLGDLMASQTSILRAVARILAESYSPRDTGA